MKKMFSKLREEDSDLASHYWWYRLIRVLALGFFVLIMIIVTIVLIVDAPTDLLGKHNIKIRSTLNSYTANYSGKDYENTVPAFFAQKGDFGILHDGKISYVSSYSLYWSFCLKSPSKYTDGIAEYIYKNLPSNIQTATSIEDQKRFVKEDLERLPQRNCYFSPLTSELGLSETESLSKSIINYRPNFIFYIEMILLVTVSGIVAMSVLFTVASLIYWGPVRYIMYGKNRD